ncbi:M35 family metallo-endopeptidase [Motiliproteus sp. MSK22-1]|uniref:M35 family metallo-endopeptidase n=1 Tax=Motiliproteus sp. MSK22-1 TaxID=1897630 RepID=UPI0009773D96|nr:M35 family metallo-endopeptidase [Motiliproteus sp. MSK22-1]OMH26246.1 hypothetical protein BGP75_01040 [Motiliproteus sp. MSK22-1]
MAMNKFTQAYDKLRAEVVTDAKYEKDWQKFLKTEISPLLAADGPNSAHAAGLDKLREKLAENNRGAFASFFLGSGVEKTIVEAASNDSSKAKLADRCAAIKMLKHFYRAEKTGAQSVWILATPKAYSKWVFDEISGAEKDIKAKLKSEKEVYTENNRKTMCTALHQAKASCQFAASKLGKPDDTTTATFKKWFDDGNTTDAVMKAKMATMGTGFTKIAAMLGSTKLVLSDEPTDRTSGGWKDWGFVYSTERMNVVYIQNAFLKASSNSGKLWQCVLTLVHEVSHREIKTDDNRYDDGSSADVAGIGLKPDSTFTFAKATNNADSWAYFCVDLKGMLSANDRKKALAGKM